MPSRAFIVVCGAIPGTFFGGLAFLGACTSFMSLVRHDSPHALRGLLVCIAGLCGFVALWYAGLRGSPPVKSKVGAAVLGVFLCFGISAATLLLTIPVWPWRILALFPILTALSIFPALYKIVAPKRADETDSQNV
jgi:hypothetical protein